jgi:tetratricopeptide (TPR) repeat protein
MMRLGPIAIVMVVCVAGLARADKAGQARAHYEQATAHFAVGEFAEAAAEYQAAFKLRPDPALLYNAAQSYRLANNPEKALILYKNYLQLYPNESNSDEVRRQIEKLREAVAAAERAKTSPPTTTSEPKQLPTTASPEPTTSATNTPPPAEGEKSEPTTAAAQPKRETPVYKKWWLWTIVGVVVAGGAVTAAVLATQSNSSWNNVPDVGPGSHSALVRW